MTRNASLLPAYLAKFTALFCLLTICGLDVRADQIEMSNGDRYVGRVVSMNADTLVLQSDVLN